MKLRNKVPKSPPWYVAITIAVMLMVVSTVEQHWTVRELVIVESIDMVGMRIIRPVYEAEERVNLLIIHPDRYSVKLYCNKLKRDIIINTCTDRQSNLTCTVHTVDRLPGKMYGGLYCVYKHIMQMEG